MDAFIKHTGIVLPMNRANVDTDAIMPKQYLKCISKFGYGDWLFDDWRYLDQGDVDTPIDQRQINPEFELNLPRYNNASILLARQNFGCGSSREHAVWGLSDYGIRAIIAPSFADIFFNNCFNNGLLAITLDQKVIDQLFATFEPEGAPALTIDLENNRIELANNSYLPFGIEAGRRENLLKGLDSIGESLSKADKITAFEDAHRNNLPWNFNALNDA